MSEFIWLLVGFGFGCIFMLNRREYKDQETLEQVDEKLRKELAINKNLVQSLKQDLSWAKQKIEALKGKK